MVEDDPRAVVLLLEGELNTATAVKFYDMFSHLLKRHIFFALDMGKVGFVSSMGWGILSKAKYEASKRGGDVVLVNLQPQVERVYRIMGFKSLLKAFDDVDDAVKYLIKRPPVP